MAKTFKTTLSIGGKVDRSLGKALKAAESSAAKTGKKIASSVASKAKETGTKIVRGAAKTAKVVGTTLVAGLAAGAVALTAFTATAVHNAAELQQQMSNVATLLDGTADQVDRRITELSDDVLKLSNTTGIATSDLTSGLYDVISAVGDTKDSMSILEIAAKAAAAGNSTTAEAVSLLTAVTKGYGDTSGEAFSKASDLAFQTVKLGQTTFPELAASIGKVTPLASALGVQQEELFGVFATLTGVTGSAAEVSTQYKGVLQGLMKPSKNMEAVLDKLGYSTGSAAIQALGFQGTMDALMKSQNGDVQLMAKLFGSVEAQTAVLSLCGAQTDQLTAKTKAMYESTGIANKAFETQTDNLPYMIQKMKNLGQNFMTSVGLKIMPYAIKLAETALPAIEKGLDRIIPVITTMIEKTSPFFEKISEKVGPFIGKVLDSLPQKLEAVGKVASTIFENISPILQKIGEVVIPIIAKVLEKLPGIIQVISTKATEVYQKIEPYITKFITKFTEFYNKVKPFVIEFGIRVKALVLSIINYAVKIGQIIAPIIAEIGQRIIALAPVLGHIISTGVEYAKKFIDASTPIIQTVLQIAGAMIEALLPVVDMIISALIPVLKIIWDYVGLLIQRFQEIAPIINNIIKVVLYLIQFLGGALSAAIKIGIDAFGDLIEYGKSVILVFSNVIDFFRNVFTGNWKGCWDNIKNIVTGVMDQCKTVVSSVIKAMIAPINLIISGVNKVISFKGGKPIPQIAFAGFANGGTVTSPTLAWVGEGGDTETIIPHKNTPRTRTLLQRATEGVYGTGSSHKSKTVNLTYAPVIYGGGQSVREELREDFERFKEFLGRQEDEDDREVFV